MVTHGIRRGNRAVSAVIPDWSRPNTILHRREMFEIEARSSALALGTFGNWLANLIIVMLFPIVQHLWGAFAFLPSSIVCFALAIFVYFYLPETRGRIVSDTALLISKGFKSHIR